MSEDVLSVIFARHTQSHHNAAKILSGQVDVGVNVHGVTQAIELASALAPFKIAAIYTTDLRRGRFLAEMIASRHPAAAVSTDRRWREVDIGRMDGMSREQAAREFPDPRYRTESAEFDFSPIGGESRRAVLLRELGALRGIYLRHAKEDGVAVVVGHGTALRTLLVFLGHTEKLHHQGGYTKLQLARIPDDSEIP